MKQKLRNVTDNRTYNIIYKNVIFASCRICQRRAGNYYKIACENNKRWGRHGSGKAIYSYKYREYKSWKYNRKKQWKK
jgi:hypothetical protein